MATGNILYARCSIKGVRPILFHKFGPEALPLEKQERTGVAGNDPTEWRKTYSATADGQLFVDVSYIFGSIRDGAKNVKKGRGSIMSVVASTLQVLDDRILIDRFVPAEPDTDSTKPVFIDVRGVRNPATKGRNVRYRLAASTGWLASFTLMWDRTIVARDQMRECLVFAGQLSGLGDGRSIGFGRFEVETFDVSDKP